MQGVIVFGLLFIASALADEAEMELPPRALACIESAKPFIKRSKACDALLDNIYSGDGYAHFDVCTRKLEEDPISQQMQENCSGLENDLNDSQTLYVIQVLKGLENE